MNTTTISGGNVRAVLLLDGWHECASIDYAGGLLSSTFEIGTVHIDNDGDGIDIDVNTMQRGYKFQDTDGVDHVGPMHAILSMKVMDEAAYLGYMQQREAK